MKLGIKCFLKDIILIEFKQFSTYMTSYVLMLDYITFNENNTDYS